MISNIKFFRKYQNLYILAMSVLFFTIMGILIYNAVADMLIDSSKANAMGLSVIAANELNGDVFDTIRSEDDPAFQETYDILDKYKDYNMLQYIYTMRYEDGVLTFVVDADDDEPAKCGEEYEYLEDMTPAFRGQVCCDSRLTKDKWGVFFSAYAPIWNSMGEVVGIVGCDINTADINFRLLKLKVLIITLIGTFTIIALIYIKLYSLSLIYIDSLTGLRSRDGLVKKGNKLKKKRLLGNGTLIQLEIKNLDYVVQEAECTEEEFLEEFAKYLKKVQPALGYVAKISSEIFFILVKKENEENALKQLMPAEVTIENAGNPKKISVYSHIGICRANEDDSMEDLIRKCSLAIDKARETTREKYIVYDEEIKRQHKEEKTVEAKFPEALSNNEFCVYYQPKVDLGTNTLCGAEALVRWKRNGEIVQPGRFIGILENSGSITKLDFYVFETVCRNLRRWLDEGLTPVTISSNFSKLHLKNPSLAEDILSVIKKYDIDPGLVEIELTESSGYTDFEALKNFVSKMEKMGIHTSIDDFGTGYSSLSLLREINVDVVKLDKTFCDDLENNDKQTGLTTNVIHMIKDLDRVVLCEGVETGRQAEILKKTDCSIVQGYYYDRPLPVEIFEERLRNPVYS